MFALKHRRVQLAMATRGGREKQICSFNTELQDTQVKKAPTAGDLIEVTQEDRRERIQRGLSRLQEPSIAFRTVYSVERAQVALPGASSRTFRDRMRKGGGSGGASKRSGGDSMLSGKRVPVAL